MWTTLVSSKQRDPNPNNHRGNKKNYAANVEWNPIDVEYAHRVEYAAIPLYVEYARRVEYA